MADKHLYWKDADFQFMVMFYFMAQAINVLGDQASYSPSEVSYAKDVSECIVNCNKISQSVAVNPTIATNVTNDSFSTMSNDIEYVVKTAYTSGASKGMFTVLSETAYPPA